MSVLMQRWQSMAGSITVYVIGMMMMMMVVVMAKYGVVGEMLVFMLNLGGSTRQ